MQSRHTLIQYRSMPRIESTYTSSNLRVRHVCTYDTWNGLFYKKPRYWQSIRQHTKVLAESTNRLNNMLKSVYVPQNAIPYNGKPLSNEEMSKREGVRVRTVRELFVALKYPGRSLRVPICFSNCEFSMFLLHQTCPRGRTFV